MVVFNKTTTIRDGNVDFDAGGCPVLVLREEAWAKNRSVQQDYGARRGQHRQREIEFTLKRTLYLISLVQA